MDCPNCKFEDVRRGDQCPACGIVINDVMGKEETLMPPAQRLAHVFCNMKPGYEVVTHPHNDLIVFAKRADGAGIRFWYDKWEDRIECSGIYPDNIDGDKRTARDWGVLSSIEKAPIATVSASRDPVKAAKDISRRVLTPYLPLFKACLERLQKQQRENASTQETARDILGVIGAEPHMVHTWSRTRFHTPVDGELYVGNHIELTLKDLTPDQAKRIMQIAAENT